MTFTSAIIVSVLCLLVAAILGGLIVYFTLNDRIRKLTRELMALQEDHSRLKTECEKIQHQLKGQVEEKEQKLLESNNQIKSLEQQHEDTRKTWQNQLEEKDEKIRALTANYAKLKEDCEKAQNELKTQLGQKNKSLEEANVALAKLREELNSRDIQAVEEAAPNADKRQLELERIRAKARDFDYSNMGVARAEEKDDLKIVSGVGPFIEEKLNALGIYTFDQVSRFNDKDVEQVTKAIEFFPGRIERDHWIDQAKKIVKERNIRKADN